MRRIRSTALILVATLVAVSCSSGSSGGSSDDVLKGGGVVGMPTTPTIKVTTTTPAKKAQTLCTAVWNPFDPTTPQGTKNLLNYAAFKAAATTATAKLSIDDATVVENSGSATLNVIVQITNPMKQELHMQWGWSTFAKTALETSDYQKSSGAVDVNIVGPESKLTSVTKTYQIKVLIQNDTTPEVDDMWRQVVENLQVRIGVCPSPAIQITKDTGVITINEDDTVFDALGKGGAEADLVDGYLLAVAATESYADRFKSESDITKYINNFLGDIYTKRGTPIIYSKSTGNSDDVMVFTTANSVIVTFRGSEQFQDFLTDLDIGFTSAGGSFLNYGLELAHNGFWNAVNNLYPDLIKVVKAQAASGKKVYITGHSLGAAMATIFALRAKRDGVAIEKVSTIGSPRAMNGSAGFEYYSLGLGNRTSRWIFDDDMVTHIPNLAILSSLCVLAMVTFPSFGMIPCTSAASVVLGDTYRHVGEVRRFEADIGGDNCIDFHLAYPSTTWGTGPYQLNDYESFSISYNDHKTARYVNAFWRSLSPAGQALVRPIPNDPRFACDGSAL